MMVQIGEFLEFCISAYLVIIFFLFADNNWEDF